MPIPSSARAASGAREIFERLEDEAHLLGVAAREAARAQLAQDVNPAWVAALATVLVAV